MNARHPFPNAHSGLHPELVDDVVADLRECRKQWRAAHHRLDKVSLEYPSRAILANIAQSLCAILFPMRLGPPGLKRREEDRFIKTTLLATMEALTKQIQLERALNISPKQTILGLPRPQDLVCDFVAELPQMRQQLDEDVLAAYRGDPAAVSVDEVLLAYPGVRALIYHRLAHGLYRRGMPIVARLIAEDAHSQTGIDIHPGAQIGEGFFIDHGTGVVIGETTVIGKNVRLYQAVTLGAKRFNRAQNGELIKNEARHPTLEDEVVVYAGATILGRITVGRRSTVGGNVWLTHSVPPNSHIAQAGVQFAPKVRTEH